MKVLHFVSKMDRAGQETFIMNIYRNIDREKIQFCFLCSIPEKADYDDEIRSLGGEIYHLPKNPCTGKFSKYFSEIRMIRDWLVENKDKYDVTHLHTYHAMDVWVHLEACRQAKAKIFVHSHNTNGMHHTLHKIMRKICHLYRYEKLACSSDAGKWLHGETLVEKGEVRVVPNGIDTAKYRYCEDTARKYKKELGVENRTVIGHIGRFHYQKNHSFLLEIFQAYLAKDPNAVLMLVGRGELEQEIRNRVHQMGIEDSVHFLGVRNDVPQLMNAFDAFLLPSVFEGLGIVLIEAQCNGLSCIASDNIPGEAVISDNIHLLPLHDPVIWADELTKLVGKRTESVNADLYDIEKVAKNLSSLYLNMI